MRYFSLGLTGCTLILATVLALGSVGCEDQVEYRQGGVLYAAYCANCHMDDGTGLRGNIPPLANSDWLRDEQDQLACVIYAGMEGEVVVNGITYNAVMNGNPELTTTQVTNIMNYINHAWGNDYGYVSLPRAEAQLENCTYGGRGLNR